MARTGKAFLGPRPGSPAGVGGGGGFLPAVTSSAAAVSRDDVVSRTIGGRAFTHYAPTQQREWTVSAENSDLVVADRVERLFRGRSRVLWIDTLALATNVLSPEASMASPASRLVTQVGGTASGPIQAADGTWFENHLAFASVGEVTISGLPVFAGPYVWTAYVQGSNVTATAGGGGVVSGSASSSALSRIAIRGGSRAATGGTATGASLHLTGVKAVTGLSLTYTADVQPWVLGQAAENASLSSLSRDPTWVDQGRLGRTHLANLRFTITDRGDLL